VTTKFVQKIGYWLDCGNSGDFLGKDPLKTQPSIFLTKTKRASVRILRKFTKLLQKRLDGRHCKR